MKVYSIGKEDTLELLRTGKMKVIDENGDEFLIREESTQK